MNIPKNLKYTNEHEWIEIQGSTATIGITDHAQSSLGDIVFLDLPQVGRVLKKNDTFGVVESIKAVSDLFAPVQGTVTEVNSSLLDNPGDINNEPYQKNWLIKMEVNPADADSLLNAEEYAEFVKSI